MKETAVATRWLALPVHVWSLLARRLKKAPMSVPDLPAALVVGFVVQMRPMVSHVEQRLVHVQHSQEHLLPRIKKGRQTKTYWQLG